ncbi:hypothetical protein MNBD_DELTA01-142 [hydrothermal vent metagenome]|uniref:Uncharacterized protein n=1 Tax=hydrothermal vent metagenome TaxID=652676 RepID=A0A3B0QQC5_9ZZZZ
MERACEQMLADRCVMDGHCHEEGPEYGWYTEPGEKASRKVSQTEEQRQV